MVPLKGKSGFLKHFMRARPIAFLQCMKQATEDFIAQFGEPPPPSSDFAEPDTLKTIEVIGVGFFDRMHGQRGRARPSGIEIHPVLSMTVIQ
jgi:hypothetical protein